MIKEENFKELYEELEHLELKIKEYTKRSKEIKDMFIMFLDSKNITEYEQHDYVVKVTNYTRKGPINEELLEAEGLDIDQYRKPPIKVNRISFQRITDI